MSHLVHLPVSDELKNALSRAKGQSSVRYLKVKIANEKLELDSTGTAGTLSLDFNGLGKVVTADEPCYFVFRYRDLYANAPWALLAYIPDSAEVKLRMVYASSFSGTRTALGAALFSKIKKFSSPDEFVWKDFENAPSDDDDEVAGTTNSSTTTPTATSPASSLTSSASSTSSATKLNSEGELDKNLPWNKRELAIHQLNQEEIQARREYEEMATKKPVPTSGFHQVSFPLTSEAEQAVKDLAAGASHNWVQLTLDSGFKNISVKTTKTITSEDDLASNIVMTEPQFYLYNRATSRTIILIYCCPEKGSTVKNRMVYSTCKASLAEQIRQLGVEQVKKFDIREESELTSKSLSDHLQSSVSDMFAPSTSIIRANNNVVRTGGGYNSGSGSSIPRSELSNKPVFNRAGYNEPVRSSPAGRGGVGAVPIMAATGSKNAPQGGLATLIGGGGAAKLPKGVVLPPKGAYC